MNDEEKVYFTTTDPEGRTISLQKKTWDKIKKGHPEIRGPKEVKSTIQNPDIITEITPRSSMAYTKIARMDLYVNVYAKMDDKYEVGRVSTTFLTSKQPRGEIIWVKSR